MSDVREWYIIGRRMYQPFFSEKELAAPFDKWLAERDAQLTAAPDEGTIVRAVSPETPTTEDVRSDYAWGSVYLASPAEAEQREAEFDRWLAQHDRDLLRAFAERHKAEGYEHLAGVLSTPTSRWLRARAEDG
ncbi:hypothetical protein [Microbacterium sp. No. 7]|uniref:hypothetical protein n=1 Tax=Microbacterium sp. No. 7 TaxID=1714373 RepID=UPI0006D197CE|nr:hypothetical protein [Microbacterium sp. No. 7]